MYNNNKINFLSYFTNKGNPPKNINIKDQKILWYNYEKFKKMSIQVFSK